MKLIFDEGMPLQAAAVLRARGIEASHVLELDMGGAPDRAILNRPVHEEALVATLDADFHRILSGTGASNPSVIRVRIEGLGSKALAELLERVMEQIASELVSGAAVSVTSKRIRVRKLPIRS